MSMLGRDPMREVRTLLVISLVLIVPILLTLFTVRVPVTEMSTTDNPTPYGYTVSLLIFLVPVVAVSILHLLEGSDADKKAFLACAGLMAGLGAFLDFFFGYAFFEFPNVGATVDFRLPAWSWGEMGWVGSYLPIEEFGFYIFGALFMVSAYIWADSKWLHLYDPDHYSEVARDLPRVIEFSPQALATWLGLLVAGIAFRFFSDGGFPGYYVFLMGFGVLPSIFMVRTLKHFVNWHALGFAFGGLVTISIVWEATLGLPYQWWTYRADQMLGIYLHAWGGLPIEEVSLWLVGVWDAVLFYELFRVLFRQKERKVRHRLFGEPSASA